MKPTFVQPRFIAIAAMGIAALGINFSGPTIPGMQRAFAAPATPQLRFPLPTGRLVYKITTTGTVPSTANITMTWIDNGGRFRQDIHANYSFGGQRQAISTWGIFDGKSYYLSMPGRGKQVIRAAIPPGAKRNLTNLLVPSAGVNVKQSKVLGHANVLGKPCEIRAMTMKMPRMQGHTKLWMWQGIPLRVESTMQFSNPGGTGKGAPAKGMAINTTMVATSLSTDFHPAPSLFRLPAGYTVRDMSSYKRPH